MSNGSMNGRSGSSRCGVGELQYEIMCRVLPYYLGFNIVPDHTFSHLIIDRLTKLKFGSNITFIYSPISCKICPGLHNPVGEYLLLRLHLSPNTIIPFLFECAVLICKAQCILTRILTFLKCSNHGSCKVVNNICKMLRIYLEFILQKNSSLGHRMMGYGALNIYMRSSACVVPVWMKNSMYCS